jgi:catechol 2,3-dioxygenase-like lactoylglutathione lyase family enzyme
MTRVTGINHAAVITADLDRFIEFYTNVFDLDVVFTEATPQIRHAILRAGERSWIHPVEAPQNPHAAGRSSTLDRGHLDHLAFDAATAEDFAELRRRLVARGASDGAIDDLGAFHSLWFRDPDGMQCEVVHIVNHTLDNIHEPRPLVA